MTPLLAAALLAADTLIVGTLADPVTLEPHRATDLVSAAILANVCEPLVRYRADGSRAEAALATTWATLDARTWTFTLRPGVRFHDGSPLDADAVVHNFDSLRRRRGFPGAARRVGPLVVSVTLDRPNSALLATLSQPFFALLSPRELAATAPRPLGTGPFRIASVRPGLVQLEAHADYWGGAPRLRQLVFRRYPGPPELLHALLGGAVDVMAAVGQEQLERLRAHPGIVLESQTGLNLAFLSINNERAPFRDRRVRQAIARALDRDALVRDVIEGHGEPARNPLPPALWGYAAHTKALVLDRVGARRLLAQAGRTAGFETTLLVVDVPRPYMPAPMRLAERIRDDLAQVGIRTSLRVAPDWPEYLERATRGDYDLAAMGWQADTLDPNDFLSALLASESVGSTNRSRYRSDEMDGLLKAGRRGRSPQERAGSYRGAQTLFQRDMPIVPLYHVAVFAAHRRGVQGMISDPTGLRRYDKAWKTE